MIELTNHAEWLTECATLGLVGPYTRVGSPNGEQFTGTCGTAALWNADKGKGYIFQGTVVRRCAHE